MLIAVFDTSPANRDKVKEWITRYSIRNDIELDMLWFSESNALLAFPKYALQIHIAFISLDDSDGVQIGQRLYQLNPDCRICYYMSQTENPLRLFRSRPFGYLLWSWGEDKFQRTLERFIRDILRADGFFVYETKRMLYCDYIRNILYFQSDLKYVNIKTISGESQSIYAKLSDVERILHGEFIRIHQRYIVNSMHLIRLDKQNHSVHMSNGEDLPVSDMWYASVLDKARGKDALSRGKVVDNKSS